MYIMYLNQIHSPYPCSPISPLFPQHISLMVSCSLFLNWVHSVLPLWAWIQDHFPERVASPSSSHPWKKKKNCLSLCLQSSIASSSSTRGGASWVLLSSMLGFWIAWSFPNSMHTVIVVVNFYVQTPCHVWQILFCCRPLLYHFCLRIDLSICFHWNHFLNIYLH